MDVIEYTPTREQYAYTFGGAAPAMRVKPGTALRLWSDDAFCGVLRSVDDLSSEKVDLRYVNPQTGPFYVEGAEPGDTLVLHLVALEPARDWGASAAIPFFGGMTGTDRTVTLQDPLPDTTWIYELDRDHNTVVFAARHSDHRIELPVEPMLGTVGVAPAGGEVRSSLVPERFGGNMDTPQMRAGTTVFLGVNVEGALFSIGDGHYRQGEGEACGTAVEGAMTTTLIVELIKGNAPGWPRLEDDDALDDGRLQPADGGLLADRQRRARRVGRRALRARTPWTPTSSAPRSRRCPSPTSSTPTTASSSRRPRRCSRPSTRSAASTPTWSPVPVRSASADPTTRSQPEGHTMDLQLDGTRVLVTGGTRGIGRAIVSAFLDEGAVVGFCARNADEVAATEQALQDRGTRHRYGARRRRRRRSRAWVEDSAAAFGGLDVVVANVSALAIPDTEENWLTSLNVDLMHTVRLVRAAMPHLESSEAASIIAISSVSGRESDFASGPYGTAKTAIVGYINGLALQLADKGIRANTVSPGQHLLRGRRLAEHRGRQPRAVRDRGRAEPDRAHGHAGGDRRTGGVPGEPSGTPGQRHQPGGRRRPDPRDPAVGQRGLDLRGSPDRLAARSAAVGRFRLFHQRQPAVSSTAPTREPMMPLGLRSRPSPDSRLINRPPTNEPTMPVTMAVDQSIRPSYRPRISWAPAPTTMPNTIMASTRYMPQRIVTA